MLLTDVSPADPACHGSTTDGTTKIGASLHRAADACRSRAKCMLPAAAAVARRRAVR